MKFKTKDLIELVQSEITRRQQRARDQDADDSAKISRGRAAYHQETTAAWREFTIRINERVYEGACVAYEDIPFALRRRMGYVDSAEIRIWNEPKLTAHEVHIHDLDRLIDALRVTTDEEVSTYGLEKMGFRLGNVLRGMSV